MATTTHQTEVGHCEAHGAFEIKSFEVCGVRVEHRNCPVCASEKAAEAKRVQAEIDARVSAENWQRQLRRAGIPERFRDRSLENYVAKTPAQKRALAFAKAYADEFGDVLAVGRSAIFIGMLGTGKTHLAAGIAMRVMRDQGKTALFSTVMRMIRTIKDTWRRDSEWTESDAIESFASPDLLVLDEVGVQFGSDAERLLLFDVLNERYERRRPTLLLSNLTAPEVSVYLGERVMDRLREDAGQIVVFDWASHRGAA